MRPLCTLWLVSLVAAGGVRARTLSAETVPGANTTHVGGGWTAVVTHENSTLYMSVVLLEEITTDDAEACHTKCLDAKSACLAWTWCPKAEAAGCTVAYGIKEHPSDTFAAGSCRLTGDNSTDSFSLFLSKGPGVKFQGGVRLFDESWVGDTGVNATQATTENSTLTVDPGATQYSAVAECGRDGLASYARADVGPPDMDAFLKGATAMAMRDFPTILQACEPTGDIKLQCGSQYDATTFFVAFVAKCASGNVTLQGWGTGEGTTPGPAGQFFSFAGPLV